MEDFKLEINIPEGYVIDVENTNINEGIIKIKKKELCYPNSISELKIKPEFFVDKIPVKDETRAKALSAFIELLELKDAWNKIDNFKPNFNDRFQEKFTIRIVNNTIGTNITYIDKSILSFKSKETRDLFLGRFKNLIETAKVFL